MLVSGVRGVSCSQLLTRIGQLPINESCRYASKTFAHGMGNRHRDPKWKKHRANQTIRIKLPDFEGIRLHGKLGPDEIRSEMKKAGVVPSRKWEERPTFVSTLAGVIEPYVPPEGDGKATLLSVSGAKQKVEQLQKKTAFMWHLRKLKQFEEGFKVVEFAPEAHEIYVKAHEALAAFKDDKDKLFELVTEGAYPEMIANVERKTLRWRMIGSLEPPRVVHIRTQNFGTEDNMFSQITVRFHTQQTLAVYDRFGRLMHGSEAMVKDVLEYVVFEKHISNLYGRWRLHAKIIPEWQANKDPSRRTFVENEKEEKKESGAQAPVANTEVAASKAAEMQ